MPEQFTVISVRRAPGAPDPIRTRVLAPTARLPHTAEEIDAAVDRLQAQAEHVARTDAGSPSRQAMFDAADVRTVVDSIRGWKPVREFDVPPGVEHDITLGADESLQVYR